LKRRRLEKAAGKATSDGSGPGEQPLGRRRAWQPDGGTPSPLDDAADLP
jgi:hypothetical protein